MAQHKTNLFSAGKLINLPELHFKLTGRFSAPRGPEEIGPGLSYIPPLTLNMKNTAPKKPMSMSIAQTASTLPSYFSWADPSSVTQNKGANLANIIMTPGNQLTCGNCWAWATTTSLSDRYAIATQSANPNLGPTYLSSCSVSGNCDPNNLQGCNGGIIQNALDVMASLIGGVASSCWNYQWCISNCDQSGNGDYNNSQLPSFGPNAQKCISSSGTPNLYKIQSNSIQSLGNFDQIKESIWTNGPLPTGFYVYTDFMMGSAPASQGGDNWATTGGIYCHLDTDSSGMTPTGDVTPYKYGTPDEMNQLAGAHAVVIVGWGQDTIPNFLPKTVPNQSTITIPYWIVRNSWGTAWGNNGFFKIAMTNSSWYLNTTVMFDQTGSNSAGGPIDFIPDTSGVPIPAPPAGPVSNSSKVSSQLSDIVSGIPRYLVNVNLLLIIALLFIYFVL